MSVDDLRRLAAAATPRPWRQDVDFPRGVDGPDGKPVTTCEKVERGIDDAALIVALANIADEVCDLIDIVRRGREEGWYEEDPRWKPLDAILARLDAKLEQP